MIQAKIVADSINIQGDRLTTLEVVMPRYILAELNTHRMLSKNSASSRAIPFSKVVKEVQERPFIPYAWQKDHKGMQGTEYLTEIEDIKSAEGEWLKARDLAIQQARYLNGIGVTKQLANRLLEPFMYHKVLVSATEFENLFNLRCPRYQIRDCNAEHSKIFKSRKELLKYFKEMDEPYYNKLINYSIIDWLSVNKGQADIHMMFLAEAMYDAMNESIPKQLKEGDWHIPYGDNMNIQTLNNYLINTDLGKTDSIETLQCKISIARCARLSYQTLGDNPVIDYEKDLALYEILSTSGHWSPFEHVAKAMTESEYNDYTRTKTEYDYEENYYKGKKVEKGWCRNFKGFIQYRELLD